MILSMQKGFSEQRREEILNCRVLIIEDDFVGRAILVQIFKKQGFKDIAEAENGKEGLEKLDSFKPDLIVCDIRMPEMDGFAFCHHVRAHPDLAVSGLPILVQTALTKSAEKAKVFLAGASDYISKPVDPVEIMARAYVHLERELMTRRLREFNLRVSQELETAKSTQHVLIPSQATISEVEKLHSLYVYGCFQFCSELGGDFWDIKSLSADEFALSTVDFAGHGVNAALNVFRLHALMHSASSVVHTPSAYMTHLNAVLKPLLPSGQFATMFYGVVNTKKNTLSYAAAAAPTPILFRQNGSYEILDSAGMLLGAWKDSVYETKEVSFNSGDCLLLYSDALTETPDGAGNMLTAEAVVELFQSEISVGGQPFEAAYKKLLGHFNTNFAPRLNDDLTLIACCRMP
jgi:sigma-B regulation protein RsbU (phosphoserine phosphatase)